MRAVIALVLGVLFGAGLTISGMTDRTKVLGFLDLFGQWNPALMFVMGSALCITIPFFFWLKKQPKPIFETDFHWPTSTRINPRVLVGGGLFGIGWGLYGICPGPAIASVYYIEPQALVFLAAMVVGMTAENTFFKLFGKKD